MFLLHSCAGRAGFYNLRLFTLRGSMTSPSILVVYSTLRIG
jgi:hypothetical protein